MILRNSCPNRPRYGLFQCGQIMVYDPRQLFVLSAMSLNAVNSRPLLNERAEFIPWPYVRSIYQLRCNGEDCKLRAQVEQVAAMPFPKQRCRKFRRLQPAFRVAYQSLEDPPAIVRRRTGPKRPLLVDLLSNSWARASYTPGQPGPFLAAQSARTAGDTR